MFADDTCPVFSDVCLGRVIEIANEKLSLIHQWCCFNKLSLNPNKSEFMLVGHRRSENFVPICIGGAAIKQVGSVKYLGVNLDEKLNFNSQVDYINSRLQPNSGITYRLRFFFNLRAANNFYYACVYSVLKYCICVWGGIFHDSNKGTSLQKLQAKIVANLFSRFHVRLYIQKG